MSGVTDAETFQDGETITDGMAGSADANGTSFASPQFTAYIVRGATPQSNFNHPNFGFKISNSTNGNSVALLQGVCRDSSGGGEATVDLQNVSNNTAYMVEARYLPSNKVIFLVQNNTTLKMEEKGVITTNLPDPTNTNTEAFYGMEITRVNGHAVQLLGSFFEYQQQLRQF
ncbi:hypothetical protein IID22_02110 [Patescibacteria group bacterium]|nr:hypothetical protein [Patescibacteria group bacterium]